jgi:hypothetical protein
MLRFIYVCRENIHIALRETLQSVFQTLDYEITDGIVVAGVRDALGDLAYPRMYDVRDLIDRFLSFHSRNVGVVEQPARYFGWNVESTFEEDRRQAIEQIQGKMIRVIEDTIDPESWKENGGSIGSAYMFAGRITVFQTPENQRRVAELLSAIRAGGFTGH